MLENPNSSEEQSVEKLLRIRATRDIRDAKLANLKVRIAQHIDLLIHDLGQPLRKSFANFAHHLLTQKEREMAELFNQLLPPGSIAGVDNRLLIQASTPVVPFAKSPTGATAYRTKISRKNWVN